MKILDKYIGFTVISGILIVLLVLVGLFSFFSFIDEVDDIGKQNYGLWQAIQYVVLEIPRNIYDVFPSAVLLGSLLGLGQLANNSELTAMRAAGISILRIAFSVLKFGLILTVIAMIIGETLAPVSGEYAKTMRTLAQSQGQQIGFSRQGFWARDGDNFINIYTIFPDGGFGGIQLYEFDSEQRLKTLISASSAYYENREWLLNNVTKVEIAANKVTRQYLKTATWNAVLNPDLIKIVKVQPRNLSSLGLYKYIDYLKQNGQRTAQYDLAFWTRLSYPLVSIAMIFLAIPFVFGSLRTVSIGQRVLVGAMLGILFHMLNQASGNIGLVYGISPIISALLPAIWFSLLAIVLMRRVI
jgi:lipopolysaccharide export system permease protein